MFVISKSYTFAASHRLPNHRGKCRNLHGHNYRVEVGVRSHLLNPLSDPSSDGMVIDFDDLDQIVKPLIELLDHTHLNESLAQLIDADPSLPAVIGANMSPTAERLALLLADRIHRALALQFDAGQSTIRLNHVRVWETEKAYAEWRTLP